MSRYVPLMDILDGTPIEARTDAFLNARLWPGFPKYPGNPYPNVVQNVDKYFQPLKPIPSPGGRVFNKSQGYAFLSNYNTYP